MSYSLSGGWWAGWDDVGCGDEGRGAGEVRGEEREVGESGGLALGAEENLGWVESGKALEGVGRGGEGEEGALGGEGFGLRAGGAEESVDGADSRGTYAEYRYGE